MRVRGNEWPATRTGSHGLIGAVRSRRLPAKVPRLAGGDVRDGRWWTEAASGLGSMTFWNWSGRALAVRWCCAAETAWVRQALQVQALAQRLPQPFTDLDLS